MTDDLAEVRQRVDAVLAQLFRDKRLTCARWDLLEPLLLAAQELTLRGGKRVRPALAVAGYAAIAPIVELEPLVRAAAAFELVQTYLLIQDDWMDGDEVRRGAPAIHIGLRQRYPDPHLANSVAILASDLSSAWAVELLLSAAFPEAAHRSALAGFHQMLEEVIAGQFLDVVGTREVELVHLYKTAGYTVRWPIRIGALLAGASAEQLAALDAFAWPVGLAFQLRDDLLGTFGDPAITGKPASSDLLAGKETALVAEARASFGQEDRALLERILGKRDATPAELTAVRQVLEQNGVRKTLEARLDVQVSLAIQGLEGAPIRADGQRRLQEIARLIAERKS